MVTDKSVSAAQCQTGRKGFIRTVHCVVLERMLFDCLQTPGVVKRKLRYYMLSSKSYTVWVQQQR